MGEGLHVALTIIAEFHVKCMEMVGSSGIEWCDISDIRNGSGRDEVTRYMFDFLARHAALLRLAGSLAIPSWVLGGPGMVKLCPWEPLS